MVAQYDKKLLHTVFEREVEQHPERVALEHAGVEWSYAQINAAANMLAAQLESVAAGHVVGFELEAGAGHLVALLAAWKAGVIAMSLELDGPPARRAQILERVQPEDVFDAPRLAPYLSLARDGLRESNRPLRTGPELGNALFHTSGSTGQPKAIVGCHKSVSHFVHWEVKQFGLDAGVRVSQLAPTTFDASLRDLFVPLICGGRVCVPPASARADAEQLHRWISAAGVSLLHCVPSLLRRLLHVWETSGGRCALENTPLRRIVLAGEALYGEDVRRAQALFGPGVDLVNMYGPSETTMVKTFHEVGADDARDPAAMVPVGHPIANTAILVVKSGRLCPIGKIGEIHIKTPFRSLGYWGDPEATAQRFVADPTDPESGDIVYATGDLGRYRADRSLEFIGRADAQVKINGTRVELGEIEVATRTFPGVRECVATVHESHDHTLSPTCYFTASASVDLEQLRSHLRSQLPTAAVPSFFVALRDFPQTATGKIDRRALPKPQELLYAQRAYVAPESATQLQLCRILGEILELDKVGVEHGFFELGGNSLRATTAIAAIQRRFRVALSLVEFMANPTVRGLATVIERAEPAPEVQGRPGVGLESQTIPASDGQRRLWMSAQIAGGNQAYEMHQAFRLRGPVDIERLEQAYRRVVARHEALRTQLEDRGGELVQVIAAELEVELEAHSLESSSAAAGLDSEEMVEAWVEAQIAAGPAFDLASAPLCRAQLLSVAEHDHLLLVTLHHVIADGVSFDVFVRELAQAYEDPSRLEHSPVLQFREHLAWLNSHASGPAYVESRDYWHAQLADGPPLAELTTDRPRPPQKGFRGAKVEGCLTADCFENCQQLARELGVTPFALLTSMVAALIARHTGQSQLRLGTILDGRDRPASGSQIGLLASTAVLCLELDAARSWSELAQSVHSKVAQARAHQYYPFEALVEAFVPQREGARSPLFDVAVVMQRDASRGIAVEALEIAPQSLATVTSKFDLTFNFGRISGDEGPDRLRWIVEYDAELFDRARVEAMSCQWQCMLEAALAGSRRSLAALPWQSEAARIQLLRQARGPALEPSAASVVELFQARARAGASAPAVIAGAQRLSYGQLDETAARIAHALAMDFDVTPGERVAVVTARSTAWPCAILAVAKTGAAYVPLDPAQPEQRLRHMLDDARVRVLLHDAEHSALAHDLAARAAGPVQTLALGDVQHQPSTPLDRAIDANTPLYVIYTSGSSGQPKGCVLTHGNLSGLLGHEDLPIDVGPEDRWLVAHSQGFDFSVWELFGAWLTGGTAVIAASETIRDPEQTRALILEAGVTVLSQTPEAFASLAAYDLERSSLALGKQLRHVVFGGERLEPRRLAPWLARYGHQSPRLTNMFGITETCVHVTAHRLTPECLTGSAVHSPIGRPLPGARVYVLDPQGELLPPGVIGELHVAGFGVAREYLGRPELTAQRFVEDPWGTGRMYRSGDLGYWGFDGNLYYVGRSDDQVQVRGHRVERGEIAARLREFATIEEAFVRARDTATGVELAAYLRVVPSGFDLAGLRRSLALSLPSYMLPARYFQIDDVPRTLNGKLDDLALASMGRELGSTQGAGRGPRNQLEASALEIWARVLERPEIGIDDDFFALGGHSLSALRLLADMRSGLGIDIELRSLFATPTIAALLEGRDSCGEKPEVPAIERVEDAAARLPLSPAQRRLWLLQQMAGAEAIYNIPIAYALEGVFEHEAFERALADVLAAHESLRTTFAVEAGEPYGRVHAVGELAVELEIVDLCGQADCDGAIEHWLQASAGQAMDLECGPLFRAAVLLCGPKQQVVALNIHHIVADGRSLEIVIRDLLRAYSGHVQGHRRALVAPQLRYRDVVQAQHGRWSDESDAAAFWRERLAGELPTLDLPSDRRRPPAATFVGATQRFEFDDATRRAFEAFATRQGLTPFMVALCGVDTLLHRYTGASDIIVGTAVAGRSDPRVADIVGLFVNTLALRNAVSGGDSFSQLADRIKDSTLQALEHGEYPFDRVVEACTRARDPSRAPIFDVMMGFNRTKASDSPPGFRARRVEFDTASSKFDLTFHFAHDADELRFDIEYNTDLFDAARIAAMGGHLQHLMAGALAQPDRPIDSLPLATAEETRTLYEWSRGGGARPGPATPLELFEQHCLMSPESTAVVGQVALSYADLRARAHAIAAELADEVAVGDRIALLTGRDENMVAAILAVTMLGAAYVAMEPDLPQSRAEHMLEDAGCRWLLADPDHIELARTWSRSARTWSQSPRGRSDFQPRRVGADALAYVMYTSGSTGRPKGVAIEQASIVSLVCDTNYIDLRPRDRVLQLSSYGFDGSTFEIYAALCHGASLHVAPREVVRSIQELSTFISEREINIAFMTTALFNRLVDFAPEVVAGFDRLMFGGQDASVAHVRRALALQKHPEVVVHVYGPTETTTFASFHVVRDVPASATRVPIGRPLSRVELAVVDEQRRLVPAGVEGELLISGAGLARGYLGQAQATAEKFVTLADVGPRSPAQRYYATGDIVRWTFDGCLDFIGRRDGQVKVRGFRVELGEIQNRICEHPGVARCHVLATQQADQTRELWAYLVVEAHASIDVEGLRAFMLESLPEYMLPARFLCVEDLPVNASAKVDELQLQAMSHTPLGLATASAAPQTPMHSLLAAAMGEVLQIDEVGIHDDYFALGGDSIKAIALATYLAGRGYRLHIRDLFSHPNIAELADHLRSISPGVRAEAESGRQPLTPVQQWFVRRHGLERKHFNQALMLVANAEVDHEAWVGAVAWVVKEHAGLRTVYGAEHQSVLTPDEFRARHESAHSVVELASLSELPGVLEGLHQSMRPDSARVFRAVAIRCPEGDRWALVAHHLAVDAVSWRIILGDLERAYEALCSGHAPSSPPASLGCGAWARTLATLQGEGLPEAERVYWSEREAEVVPPLLPNAEGPGLQGAAQTEKVVMSERHTQEVWVSAHGAHRTRVDDLLLAGLAVALGRVFGRCTTRVLLEGHGRDLIEGVDLSRTVGWLTCMYPIVLEQTGNSAGDDRHDWARQIENTKSTLGGVPQSGRGYAAADTPADAAWPVDLSYNNLGRFDPPSAAGRFAWAPEAVGPTIDPLAPRDALLECAAMTLEGRMQLSVTGPGNSAVQSLWQPLCAAWHTALLQLLEHCRTRGNSAPMVADIDFDGFDQAGLDAFLDELEA